MNIDKGQKVLVELTVDDMVGLAALVMSLQQELPQLLDAHPGIAERLVHSVINRSCPLTPEAAKAWEVIISKMGPEVKENGVH